MIIYMSFGLMMSAFAETEFTTNKKRLANQGDLEAQYDLGIMYQYGDGDADQDIAEAMKWFRMSANRGYAPAQTNLGYKYYQGDIVAQNNTQAIKWFRKAAVQNDPLAQFNLGVMYSDGIGTPKNNKEAIKWLQKSANQGYKSAQDYLDAMRPADMDTVNMYIVEGAVVEACAHPDCKSHQIDFDNEDPLYQHDY